MRASEFIDRKKNEIFAFLWAMVAGLLFVCLWSYTPGDIRFEVSTPNLPVHNYAGIAGAYLSWALFFVFGQSAYFFVLLFCLWAFASWSGRKKQSVLIKLFSGTIFFVSACACLALLAGDEPTQRFQGGGLIGFFLAHILREVFGRAAFYIALTLFFLSVLLAAEFLVFPVIGAFLISAKKFIEGWLLHLRNSRRQPAATSRNASRPTFFDADKIKMQTQRETQLEEGRKKLLGGKEPPLIRTIIPKKSLAPKQVVQQPPQKSLKTQEGEYQLPPADLLKDPVAGSSEQNQDEIEEQSRVLEETLLDFGIEARVVEVEQGPVITRYELQPASGVKVQRIVNLTDDIALAMKATSIRVIAPIPGKARVGIEAPNRTVSLVTLKEILMTPEFKNCRSKLTVAIGKDTAGSPVVANLDILPHLLIAGSTGSGKTVCVNSIITSLLYNASPDEVKLILIDPKMVELSCYKGLPHLLVPVVTDSEKVTGVLTWLVSEMERRYRILSAEGVRNISSYNRKMGSPIRMPYIVMFIDELADLMVSLGKEIEGAIMRLAQLARAVGIHLVLATQRPSVDVITGVIKANFPARISFQVASKVDSRTVLDMNGADALLGRGDLLFLDPALTKPVRAQGSFVTDEEIERTAEFIKKQRDPEFDESILNTTAKKGDGSHDFRNDEYYEEACRIIVQSGQASVSMLQRRLGLGYTRAARLVDMMEEDGIVGPFRGSKGREVLMDVETLLQKQKSAEETSEINESDAGESPSP